MTQELKLQIPSAFMTSAWNKEDVENSFNYMKEDEIELTESQWEAVVTKFNAVDTQEYLCSNSYDFVAIATALDDIIVEVIGK